MENLGQRWGLIFGCLGLLAALALLAVLRETALIGRFPGAIALGATTMLIASRGLGGNIEAPVARGTLMRAAGLGTAVAVAALELGVLAGSVSRLWVHGDIQRLGLGPALFDYMAKPIYWVSLFGLVPTVVLGVCFGITLRSALQTERHKVA